MQRMIGDLPEAFVYNHGAQSMSATRPGVRARRGNYAARDPKQTYRYARQLEARHLPCHEGPDV